MNLLTPDDITFDSSVTMTPDPSIPDDDPIHAYDVIRTKITTRKNEKED